MSKKYTPRRASKRWLDGDCPDWVLDIFDNPAYGDRYTIIYGKALAFHTKVDGSLGALPDQYHNTYLQHLSASENPTHPQGIGMHGEFSAHDAAMYRLRNKHRKVKWSSLPERLRAFVLTNGPEV